MRLRVVTEARVGADVRAPDHLRFFQQRAEQAMGPWQRADPVPGRGVHPGGEKQCEPAVTVGHTDRGVTGSRQIACAVQDVLQHLLAAPLGAELTDHVEQPA